MIKAAVTDSANQGFWDMGGGVAGTPHRTRYPNGSVFPPSIVDNFGSSVAKQASVSVPLNSYYVYSLKTRSIGWTNAVNTNNISGFGTNTVLYPSTCILGRSEGSSAGTFSFFSGNIAEALIFTNILDSSQVNTVRNYLKEKYDIDW